MSQFGFLRSQLRKGLTLGLTFVDRAGAVFENEKAIKVSRKISQGASVGVSRRSEGFCGVSPGKAKKEIPRQADVGLGRSTGGSARSIHFDGTSAQNLKVEDGRRMTKG
ncbi:MAG: hypothetical protein ACXADF_18960, partial [Candidatus Thorarchaeota archaeon]